MKNKSFGQRLFHFLKNMDADKFDDYTTPELELIKSGRRTQEQIDFAITFRNIVVTIFIIVTILFCFIKYICVQDKAFFRSYIRRRLY